MTPTTSSSRGFVFYGCGRLVFEVTDVREKDDYTKEELLLYLSFLTEGAMKFLKFAALFALAAIPLLILKKEKAPKPASEVDSDHIFDSELSVE